MLLAVNREGRVDSACCGGPMVHALQPKASQLPFGVGLADLPGRSPGSRVSDDRRKVRGHLAVVAALPGGKEAATRLDDLVVVEAQVGRFKR